MKCYNQSSENVCYFILADWIAFQQEFLRTTHFEYIVLLVLINELQLLFSGQPEALALLPDSFRNDSLWKCILGYFQHELLLLQPTNKYTHNVIHSFINTKNFNC